MSEDKTEATITIGQGFLDDAWNVTCAWCGEVAHQVSRTEADEAVRFHAEVECAEDDADIGRDGVPS